MGDTIPAPTFIDGFKRGLVTVLVGIAINKTVESISTQVIDISLTPIVSAFFIVSALELVWKSKFWNPPYLIGFGAGLIIPSHFFKLSDICNSSDTSSIYLENNKKILIFRSAKNMQIEDIYF